MKISLQEFSQMQRLTFDVREPHKGEMQHYEAFVYPICWRKRVSRSGRNCVGRDLATYVVAHASDEYAVVSLDIARSPGLLRVFKTPK